MSSIGIAPPPHRVREWLLKTLPDGFPVVKTNMVGEADVVLEEHSRTSYDDEKNRTERTVTQFGFLAVPDAEAVKEMVEAQKTKQR